MTDYILLWLLVFMFTIFACIILEATGIADALYRWWQGEGAFTIIYKEDKDDLSIQETDRNNE